MNDDNSSEQSGGARVKRATSVHTAHSTGAHAHDDVRDGEGPFAHLDKRFSEASSSDGASTKSTKPRHLEPSHPNEPLAAVNDYHELAARKWVNSVIIVCSTILVLSYFRVNLAISVIFIALGVYSTRREVENLKRDFAWDFERQKALKAVRADDWEGETVEWLNEAVKEVWPILDPNLFVAGVDLLEDAMKALSPKAVRTVRIPSLEQGTNPIRLLNIKCLPDDSDITANEGKQNKVYDFTADPQASERLKSLSWGMTEKDEPGKWKNFEVEFAYRRLPPPADRSVNTHFLLYLGIGVKKLVKFEIPVWVELSGLHGKIRLRMQLVSEPPFIKNLRFSFPTLPAMEIVAKPLKSINIMTLPGFSHYILKSVNSVLSNFTAPRSYVLDISRFFLGSDVAMKTNSVGVICLLVHGCEGLASADSRGSSDSYFRVSFSNAAKNLYTSRVQPAELNPAWEEMVFIRMSEDNLQDQEELEVAIFDHDRYTRDDPLGMISISTYDLWDKAGKFRHEQVPLRSARRKSEAQGTISYSVAFFELARSLIQRKEKAGAVQNEGGSEDAMTTEDEQQRQAKTPQKSAVKEKAKPTFVTRSEPVESASSLYARRMREMLDARLPASESQPTGILAFQIHQLSGLAFKDVSNSKLMSREPKDKAIPSSYVSVFLNDEKVFQTRTKPFSGEPYFNASSETFCRDWTTSRVDLVVMQAKDREHDSVLGSISINLKDMLTGHSQVTKWMTIGGAEGVGRLRYSLLFKPLDICLDKRLRAWNVGCLEIDAITVKGLRDETHAKIQGEVDSLAKFASPVQTSKQEAQRATHEICWSFATPMVLPILTRHTTPLVLELVGKSSFSRSNSIGEAVSWLSDVADGESVTVELPLYSTDLERRRYVRDHSPLPIPTLPKRKSKKAKDAQKQSAEGSVAQDTPSNSQEKSDSLARTQIPGTIEGAIVLQMRWVPGMSARHRDIVYHAPKAVRDAYQMWLFRNDTAPEIPHLSSAPSQAARTGSRNSLDDDEWLDQDLEGLDASRLLSAKDKDKLRVRKPGTAGWIAHGVKVGFKKMKNGGKDRRASGPAPEMENISSF